MGLITEGRKTKDERRKTSIILRPSFIVGVRMEHWELAALNIAAMAFMGAIGWFMKASIGLLKRSITQIDDRLKAGDDRFKELNVFMSDLKEKRALDREYFAKEYVSKDDFIRDIRALDFKIDLVSADVKKLLVLSGRRDNAEI